MSAHTYAVYFDAAQNINSIERDDFTPVKWTDADFQAWNNALQTPNKLSANQTALLQARSLTLAQLQAATPSQIGLLLFMLLKNTNTGVV